ncbi:MAG: DUF927 domain-containing protein [Alcaligenaceae bacterium]|nr:DUF927 domain-containing protein [Alcaligenaceae bacterium]
MNTIETEQDLTSMSIDDQTQSVDPFPTLKDRPCYRVYEHPFMRGGRTYRDGVYYHHMTKSKDGEPQNPIDDYLCGVLKIIADTKDTSGQNYGKLLAFKTKDHMGEKRLNVPMDMVLNDRAGDLIKVLGNEGLYIEFHNRGRINAYVNSQRPDRYMEAAHSTGWHSNSFVLPDEVIGSGDVWFQSRERIAAYSSRGDLAGWQAGVSDKAIGNPLLQLAICGALAGVLLKRIGNKGGGLHFYGASSKGKSTALEAAASVWGKGDTFYQTWNATSNALEGTARLHTDTMLGLDEIHNCKPRDLDNAVYALLNGAGRGRANERGDARNIARWRVFCISNGEYSIPDALARDHIKHMAGQGVRLLDIYATGEEYGFFSNIHDASSPALFAQHLKAASNLHYGHAGKAFVRHLVKLSEDKEPDYSDMVNGITNSLTTTTTGDQERWAAQLFALCALAGELAIEAKILTWKAGHAIQAAKHGFKVWLEQRGTNGRNAEDIAIFKGILNFIDAHGGARFEAVDGEDRTIMNRAGWKRIDGNKTIYMFTSGGLEEAAGRGIRQATKALASIDAFIDKDQGSYRKKIRVNDGRVSLYHLNIEAIEKVAYE